MALVKNAVPVHDGFAHAEAEGPVPEGPVIVPLARLLAEHDTLLAGNRPVGVLVPNHADVRALAPYLSKLALVALVFPKFRDGRAFSQARVLREHLGFSGEVRATGQVLRDQILLMARCGFDAFEVSKPGDVAAVAAVLKSYSRFYQPTGDGRATILDLRRAARVAVGADA